MIRDLSDEAQDFVRRGTSEGELTLECTAYMRYVGQDWEVPVPIEVRDYDDADWQGFRALFDDCYERFFGRTIEGLDVEIVSWSLRATSQVPALSVAGVISPKRAIEKSPHRERL